MPPSQPIKICFVITQGESGGAQRYVFDLATNLPKDEFSISVLVGEDGGELKNKLEQTGVQVGIVKNLVRDIHPLKDVLVIFELARLMKKIRPDTVHLNSSKAGVVGSFAAHLAGVPRTIFTAHGFAFLEPNSRMMRQLYYWAEKLASLFRDKIICVSEYDREQAIRMNLCKPEKLVTIHNGINFSKISPVSKLPSPNSRTIGTIAHLYKTKGLEHLIQAAREIDAQFVIIGEGPERANLEFQISNFKFQNKVKLLGQKENAANYLPQFDIFVLPSVKEGFPYTLLEAMAAGKPIVATAVGGIPEALGDTGILVPPKDPKALADAINSLIQNRDLAKKMGSSARERVKNFTLEKMLAATIKHY